MWRAPPFGHGGIRGTRPAVAGGGGGGGSGGLLHDRPGQVSPAQDTEPAVAGGGGLCVAPGLRR